MQMFVPVKPELRKNGPMTELTAEEAEAVRGWLNTHQFERVSSIGGDSGPFGDRQDVWDRDGTLIRLTRDRGQWWYDLSRRSTNAWLDIDAVAGAMGLKSSTPMERLVHLAGSIDDRVFSALCSSIQHSP